MSRSMAQYGGLKRHEPHDETGETHLLSRFGFKMQGGISQVP